MPEGRLAREARDFAERLDTLLNRTITSRAEVTVRLVPDNEYAIVGPGVVGAASRLSDVGFVPCSTARSSAAREEAALWLRVFFIVEMDAEGDHLAVRSSTFGFCVDRRTGLCPIRVEYDRHKTAKPQAHVQIHGASGSLGYAYAISGQQVKELHKLHIPLGGRRFRPSLEDFIEFLAQERLVPHLKPGWRSAIDEGRSDWEKRQAMATVRRAPDAAVEQLRRMGYKVSPPR